MENDKYICKCDKARKGGIFKTIATYKHHLKTFHSTEDKSRIIIPDCASHDLSGNFIVRKRNS